jgi:thiamine biosynthesis lipoprotein
MKDVRADIMGMPITVEVVDAHAQVEDICDVFDYFKNVDARFSTYRFDSEISRINRGELNVESWSDAMREIFTRADDTRLDTGGYFDIRNPAGSIDPSGIVKGWAIRQAAHMLDDRGFLNFFVDAGGDIECRGLNHHGNLWSIGIRNPLNRKEVVKRVCITDKGIATSGSYIRGHHIYDPHDPGHPPNTFLSVTVIGPDVYEADRFATAAFAMGERGLYFIESYPGLEAYAINASGIAMWTTGFGAFCA